MWWQTPLNCGYNISGHKKPVGASAGRLLVVDWFSHHRIIYSRWQLFLLIWAFLVFQQPDRVYNYYYSVCHTSVHLYFSLFSVKTSWTTFHLLYNIVCGCMAIFLQNCGKYLTFFFFRAHVKKKFNSCFIFLHFQRGVTLVIKCHPFIPPADSNFRLLSVFRPFSPSKCKRFL